MYDRTLKLDGNWRLFISKQAECRKFAFNLSTVEEVAKTGITEIKGTVPGNYELDMMREGLLEDLFFGTNILKAQEMEDNHLWYATTFNWDKSEDGKVSLNFDGIDTISDIYLNGQHIARTDNMLIGYSFDVTDKLLPENELLVHISPCYLEAQKRPNGAECYCFGYGVDALNIRKAPHMYGWDIMPRILSGGIWRSVTLIENIGTKITDTYIHTAYANQEKAEIFGYFEITPFDDVRNHSLKIDGKCGDSTFHLDYPLWHNCGQFNVVIENPKLWWPRTMGEPNLYEVTISLYYKDQLLDTKIQNVGIRTVEHVRSSVTDNEGNGEFKFIVNGQDMFVMGTNWVPLDAFHSRDKERYPKALAMVEELGVNLIRCWGGNVYEDHEFYDACDKMGIAVWQDFAMGCAVYPQNEDFCARIKEEIEYVSKKLRNHPSLFIYTGDNECDSAYTVLSSYRSDPNANVITRKVIPEVLRRTDPYRPYMPSSPYLDSNAWKEEDGLWRLPEEHLWGPREYCKAEYYNEAPCHFAGETGYHGCPSPESIKKFISPENIWPWNNDEWQLHATCIELGEDVPYKYRLPLMENQVRILFGEVPDNIEDFALASQLSQGEAVKFFIERFRSGKWRRTGIIWWNLVDGWPQFSDGIVDYYFTKKASYYFIKRSQQPVCLMFREPVDGKLELVAANETNKKVTVKYTVKDLATDKQVLSGECEVDKFSNTDADFVADDGKLHFYVMEWEYNGIKGKNHYLIGGIPYDLKQYVAWLKQADLLQTEGF